MANNRYIGEYPVIGIRPIVDGRRGPMQLRESLEDQVMAMAEAAKKLFEENLYYSNGEHVKVVMADTILFRLLGMVLVWSPFKLRQWTERWINQVPLTRAVGVAGLVIGADMLLLGWCVY